LCDAAVRDASSCTRSLPTWSSRSIAFGGPPITLRVVTVYRGGELIDDYRIFMDVAPLFEADG
jgi:hypothetical protein